MPQDSSLKDYRERLTYFQNSDVKRNALMNVSYMPPDCFSMPEID